MENAKSPRKYSTEWYESFQFDQDTRYYGVFIKNTDASRHILVDPKRYLKVFHVSADRIKENMKEVMGKRHGPLFQPARRKYFDYNVNVVKDELGKIRRDWETDLKPMIARILSEICGKKFFAGDGADDELLHTGIIDHEEAAERAMMKTQMSKTFAEFKRNELYASLYSQYFHQLASQIEGVILKILTRNGYDDETFSRKQFYKFTPGMEEGVYRLEGHTEFDKLYTVWCFLKYNSLSMYKAVKAKFPEILKEEASEYKKKTYEQGETAIYEALRSKFPEILETEAYGSGDYAVYVALQPELPETLKPGVPRKEVYGQGIMAMYNALLANFPDLQKKISVHGEAEMYDLFPEIQYEQREKVLRDRGLLSEVYEQGEMAWRYIELSDGLIETILNGVERFLIEYCLLVFKENELEACWNSDEHFYTNAMMTIRAEQDPMGLDSYF